VVKHFQKNGSVTSVGFCGAGVSQQVLDRGSIEKSLRRGDDANKTIRQQRVAIPIK
jgi:hypothetical protein